MKLISYGLGDKFQAEKFTPISNRNFVKPKGGLWASPVDSEYGWKDWCKDNDFGDLKTRFEFEYSGTILVIDSLSDLEKIPWKSYMGILEYPDFESIQERGFDAIFLTKKGEAETRFSEPSLYGWDCECVLIMNDQQINIDNCL